MSDLGAEVTQAEKRRFAEEWLLTSDPRKAALKVFTHKPVGFAMWCADNLPNDPEIVKLKADLLATQGGEEAFLPLATKAAFARKILEIVDEQPSPDTPKHSANSRLRGLELYGETMGFIQRANKANDAALEVNINDLLKQIEPSLPG
jgi:hypothetical protein